MGFSNLNECSPDSKREMYQVGDWVEVLSKEEILATLDERACMENLPFMPEMFDYCGKRFRVFKSAHKTCDTVYEYKGRRMRNAVHLDLRCDGRAHGGCEAGCLIFWKTAWVKKVDGPGTSLPVLREQCVGRQVRSGKCTEANVWAAVTRTSDGQGPINYACQATQLPAATEPLPWWEPTQYVEDYRSGNVGLWRILRSFAYRTYRRCLVNLGIGIGPLMVWIYNLVQRVRRGVPYPSLHGRIPAGQRTPLEKLDLQPGEWVRVKSFDEIRATCDEGDLNRGLKFDPEMVPYCGGTYRVLRRVSRIVDEKTGKIQEMKFPCIVLDSVVCQAWYSQCRLFCPRSIHPYWREIWLERVSPQATSDVPVQTELGSTLVQDRR